MSEGGELTRPGQQCGDTGVFKAVLLALPSPTIIVKIFLLKLGICKDPKAVYCLKESQPDP